MSEDVAARALLRPLKFTYMLTQEEIKELIQIGRLKPATTLATWEGEPRAFLMVPELFDEIE